MTALALDGATLLTARGAERRPLFVADGRIAAAAPAGARRLDLEGWVVLPGLVNAHDHLTLEGIPVPERLPPLPSAYAWIERFQPFFEHEDVVRALAVPAAERARLGAWRNLRAGAVVVAHHDPWEPVFDEPDFPVQVVKRYGWCHSLGLAGRYGPGVVESFAATPAGAPWFIHLSEGTDDVAAGELARLDALGCLAASTVLVHGVGLTDADVELVIARGAAVVWCPSSNLTILGKTLEPRRLLEAGRLALGTDSRLSGSGDLLEEMRLAVRHGLTPGEALGLVTGDAARILGLARDGSLDPGQPANLMVLRDPGDPWTALFSPEARPVPLSAFAAARSDGATPSGFPPAPSAA